MAEQVSQNSPQRSRPPKASTNAPNSTNVSRVNSHFPTQVNTPDTRDLEESLKSLQDEIRSKQRLLQNLNQDVSQIDEKLQEEIYSRDKYISLLNEQILSYKAGNLELKQQHIKELDEKLEKLRIQKNRLEEDNENLHGKILEKDAEILENQNQFDAEREEFHHQLTEANKQIEDERAITNTKQREADDIKTDLIEMAKIVQNMTGINKNLENKITEQNLAVEKANAERFTYKIKAQSAEELEHKLADEMNQHSIAQKKIEKLEKLNERYRYEKSLL